ncbi:hypothetical protein X474_25930 [Dethiosulfatarculus sandiegensis]|uniref:Uncharacterized protein n=1 Tax=Dethiosulfatarculus sandiegensis TaxID=1429043 RepID=A0A0D2IZ06_9BACT|nr:hypothetical protein X474_25930 [Dethiosulfatarculus sandiegensis]
MYRLYTSEGIRPEKNIRPDVINGRGLIFMAFI